MDLSIIHNTSIAILALAPGPIWILKECTAQYANQAFTVDKVHWPTFILVESLYILIILKIFLLTTPVLQ